MDDSMVDISAQVCKNVMIKLAYLPFLCEALKRQFSLFLMQSKMK